MWHEARKQERKIRGMLVDYRKRAERRQDFYERIRADPTQFIQIHGRKCKIHLDPSVAAAGDSPAIMMPWQGHQDIMIDRFDGRAHLDYIAQTAKTEEPEELTQEERQGNYERYRILAQNDFLGISEDKYLHQLYLEEQFGVNAQIEAEKAASKKKSGGVTIGYVYEETDPAPPTFSDTLQTVSSASGERGGESSDSELDMDVSIDVSKLDTSQAHEINEYGRNYGMKSNDFYSFLTKDADEADALRLAKEEEQEKIMFSGRKSRRERRAQRDKKLTRRPFSPPSYAAPEEKPALKEGSDKNNSDESRSPSPVNSGKITYITSFGGEDELQPHSKISINFNKNLKGETLSKVEHSSTLGSLLDSGRPMTYAEKVKQNLDKLKVMNNMPPAKPPATGQVEYVGKPVRYLRTNSVHRSRSRSRGRNRRYSRSRSRSKRRRWSSRRSRSSSRSSDRRNRSSRRGRRSRRSSSSSSSPSPRRKRRYSSSSSSSSTSSSSESPKRARSTSSSSSTSSTSPERRKSVPVVKKMASKSPAPAVPAPAPSEEKEKIVVKAEVTVQPPPEVPVKRYYGRKREDRSSSSSSDTEPTDGGESKSGNDSSSTSRAATNSSNTIVGKTTASETKVSSCLSLKVNPRDRLKRKMQILLNKQFKADKKAEIERTERQMQQQQERDDEMRELALRLRRRQRELRHKYGTPSSSRSRSQSQSPARLDEEDLYRPREKARSRSRRRSEDRVRHRRDRSRERSRDRRRSRNRSRGRSRDSRSRYRRSRSDSRGRKARRSRSRSRSRRSRRSDSRDRSHSQKSIKKLVDY